MTGDYDYRLIESSGGVKLEIKLKKENVISEFSSENLDCQRVNFRRINKYSNVNLMSAEILRNTR